jgi:hypothetical protein
VLHAEPSSPVSIDLSSSNVNEGILDGATNNLLTLSFDDSNWDVPQTVTVTGVDDAIEDGDVDYEIITSSIVSLDAGYLGIDPTDVSVTNIDDEVPSTNSNNLYVYDIRFDSKRGGKDWRAVVEIRDIDGNAVEGVTLKVDFSGTTYTLTTDSNGIARTSWERNLADGDYLADAYDLALEGFAWNPLLDLEFDSDGDGNPDDLLIV